MKSNFVAYIKSFAWANRKWGWWKMSKFFFFVLSRQKKSDTSDDVRFVEKIEVSFELGGVYSSTSE